MLITLLLVAAADPSLIDVRGQLENASAWSDGHGNYVVTIGTDSFFGDGNVLNLMRPHWSGAPRFFDERYERSVIQFEGFAGEQGTASCGTRTSKLDPVPNPAKKFAKAVFKRPRLEFKPYTLARDDHGVYYYVDRGAFDDNATVYRVFAGQRGAMKALKLKNIVHDSVGDVFATADGELRLLVGPQKASEWLKGSTHTVLTDVPIDPNTQLIYNELGVYANQRMGTFCDVL